MRYAIVDTLHINKNADNRREYANLNLPFWLDLSKSVDNNDKRLGVLATYAIKTTFSIHHPVFDHEEEAEMFIDLLNEFSGYSRFKYKEVE